MLRLGSLDPRVSRVLACVLSAGLHLCLLGLIMTYSGRYDGVDDSETPITRLSLLKSRLADRRDGVELPLPEVSVPPIHTTIDLQQPLLADNESPEREPHEAEVDAGEEIVAQPAELPIAQPESVAVSELPATVVVPEVDESRLVQHLVQLAPKLLRTPQAQVAWRQDGKQYKATMTLERAKDGVEFDRVVAEISAEHHGKQVTTRLNLKRLAFSHFTQVIDTWDPMVQLHDDEIVGRVHINSRFNLLHDRRVAPKFLGKFTTAASSFDTESIGRSSDADIFRGGIETRAGRIALPDDVQPFAWATRDSEVRVHELANDTDLRFFADGSYMWRDHEASATQHRGQPSQQPVYFLGAPGATLYVQGVVSGQVLIYSPRRLVVTGSLAYAHDPRRIPDSGDYLGMVSDRFIEIAPPEVTGPGDVEIHAALFAGRRFIIREIDYARPATLRIFGSLCAGSMTASEPRYAMKIEYDSRFERQRPPGFPSTDRFAAQDWDGRWTESPGPSELEPE